MLTVEQAAGKVISFGDAMEFSKQGISVSNENWGFRERVSGHPLPIRVSADKIWSAENKKAALRNRDNAITVRPYMTKTDGNHVDNWMPTSKDMYDNWMLSATFPRLVSIVKGTTQCSYDLKFDFVQDEHPHHPFWMLYDQDMIGYGAETVYISGSIISALRGLDVIDRMNEVIQSRIVGDGILETIILAETQNSGCHQLIHVTPDRTLNNKSGYLNIQRGDFDHEVLKIIGNTMDHVNIFIDVDSLNEVNLPNGENALEYIKGIVDKLAEDNAYINWVAVSFSEQKELSQ